VPKMQPPLKTCSQRAWAASPAAAMGKVQLVAPRCCRTCATSQHPKDARQSAHVALVLNLVKRLTGKMLGEKAPWADSYVTAGVRGPLRLCTPWKVVEWAPGGVCHGEGAEQNDLLNNICH